MPDVIYSFYKLASITAWTNYLYKNVNVFGSNKTGATFESTLNGREYLEHRKVIHRYSDLFWPARLAILTSPGYFSWRYLKQKVQKKGPFQDANHLERIILETYQEISRHMIKNVLR